MIGHFYNKSIRKYVLLMTNLFSNIYVERDRGLMQVPITYASKERFVAKLLNMQMDPNVPKIETILPRINFHLVNMTYDATRKTNSANRRNVYAQNPSRPTLNSQFNAVPYDFEFELGVWTRHQDDMFQIIEQILPYFQPQFVCQIKELNENEIVIDHRDIPITLDSVQMSEDVEGEMSSKRRLEWILNFRLKGWLYPSTSQAFGEIRTIYLNFNDDEKELVVINAEREPVSSNLDINIDIRDTASKDMVIKWHGVITGDSELIWQIHSGAQNDVDVNYSITQQINENIDVNFDIN